MHLTIYGVKPADRKWPDWLNRQVDEKAVANIDPKTFQQEDWYGESGRFLVLIHFGSHLKDGDEESKKSAAALEKNWQDLPGGVRGRVWWVIYSGSGYWNLVSTKPNVHYFRNPVSRTWLSDDEQGYFRKFAKALESD